MIRKPAKTEAQIDAELVEKPQAKRDAPKDFVLEMGHDGLYRIKYSAGGEVPDELKGAYTGISRAQAAIDNHKAMQRQQ